MARAAVETRGRESALRALAVPLLRRPFLLSKLAFVSTSLDRLRSLARERALVATSAATIGWDQETYLPDDGHEWRADQLAWLSERAHELGTSAAWGDALAAAEADATAPALTAAMRRDF